MPGLVQREEEERPIGTQLHSELAASANAR